MMEQAYVALFLYVGLPILSLVVILQLLAGVPVLEVLFGILEFIFELIV